MCPAENPIANDQTAEQPLVLVVEDEVIVRMAVAAHLRDCGFTVAEAGNGTEAQALVLAGLRPQVVFSDVNMPDMDGIALALWLTSYGVDAPIVLTSGMETSLEAARGACANVRAFLPKPYDHGRIVEQLRALIA